MNIDTVITSAQNEALKLTSEMDAIFEPFKGECEAPEYMPEPEYVKWSVLWQIRRGIFDRLDKIERAKSSLLNYIQMEVC